MNVTVNFVNCFLKKYSIDILINQNDTYIIQKAFIHESFIKKENGNKIINGVVYNESYETLEWLGDALLKSGISIYLYQRYGQRGGGTGICDEGFYTTLRSKIERCDQFARISMINNFDKYIVFDGCIDMYNKDKIMEDVFEAFIGALSMIMNIDLLHQLIKNIIETEYDFSELINGDENFKDILTQKFNRKRLSTPIYKNFYNQMKANIDNQFKSTVNDSNGKKYSSGFGRTKKIAEQNAAKLTLIEHFNFSNINNDVEDFEI